MKDQNLRMPISLKGIDRRPHENLPDGALLDLINLRFNNGSLRPTPNKVRITPNPPLRVLYRHTISETIYADWGINGSYIGYVIYENGTGVNQELNYYSCTGDVVFSPLGNSLMMSDRATEKTIVFLFLPDTNTYRTFDGFLPALPVVSYQRAVKNTDDEIYYSEGFASTGSWQEDSTLVDNAFKGYAQEMLAKKLKKGYLVGRYLVRAAWELFDGTIVMHTTPMWIAISVIEGQVHVHAELWQNIKFTGYELQYFLHMETSELNDIKTKYKGIIKSFNIYTTNTSPLYERVGWMALPRPDGSYSAWYDITVADNYSLGDQIAWVNGEVNYFELLKADLSSLTANAWQSLYTMRSDLSDISSQVIMLVGNLAVHRLYGESLFTYNQRVFIGNIKNTLFPGNTLKGIMYLSQYGMVGPAYEIGLTYDLDTASGTKRVFSGWQSCNYYRQKAEDDVTNADIHTTNTIGKTGKTWTVNGFTGMMVTIYGGTGINQSRIIASNTADTLTVTGNWVTEPENDSDFRILSPDYYSFTLRDYIGYPDVRAKYVDIWHREGGVIHHLYTIPLQQVYGVGFSWINPIAFLPLDTTGYARVSKLQSDWTVFASVGENASYVDGDRIQATEFENPFYFPAVNSYRVDGFVMGMAINAQALSQGQFGQFPIFAFTSRGIWVLNIGDGEILITSIRSLSGVVCTNRRSIIGIDGGVIFMSNLGLMILSGTTPQPISDMIIGTPVSPCNDVLDYNKILNNPNAYEPGDYIDGVSFETYAVGGEIAYIEVNTANGVEREIIVSNSDYNYSYVFSFGSKSWYRITQVWNNFIHDFPKTFGSKTGPILDDLTQEVTDIAQENPIMVHAETRPVRAGEEISHKKLHRTLLYGLIDMGSEKPFTFFLLGSVDDKNYFVQQASQMVTPGEKVALGRTGFSCRTFIFVLGGYVYDKSYISGIITDIEKRYNQKIL